MYFASGVYYFEQPVTVSGNANVVVGYGLDELPNPDCSDDIQVAANVLGTPGTFDINGGGATWVFGRDGRLVIDDAATTTSLRVRFNQRYADADRGGRISIMTVNGDDCRRRRRTWSPTSTRCPGRRLLNVIDNPESRLDTGTQRVRAVDVGIRWRADGLTDKARVPHAPTRLHGDATALLRRHSEHGAILLTWNEVTGQAAGGAFIDGYNVTINPPPSGPPRLSSRRPRGDRRTGVHARCRAS